ncbi:MAG: hypothetical protein QW734_09175 [Candidatus Bathyarchaeia archaeon]|nr:hypothetical protein [Candidatus Bathyarchaeota archaeon]
MLVSAIMAEVARELKEDTHLWKIVGLLHDLDYDEVKEICKGMELLPQRVEG